MDIKDYLHLYLGCDCYYPPKENGEKGGYIRLRPETLKYADQVKPILRPLSDMTEEEENEIAELCHLFSGLNLKKAIIYKTKYLIRAEDSFELTRYLLSRHFDLFGLVEANLAIDKSKITTV